MMKAGREEASKVMGPLFPRLHVNDTDKGGPRAPPRNKMAMYEQLSIPSQRLNHSSMSSLPLLPQSNCNVVPSASVSQGCGHERAMFSSHYVPHQPHSQPTEEVQSHSLSGKKVSNSRLELERKSSKFASHRSLKSLGNSKSAADFSSFPPTSFYNLMDSSKDKSEDEDDFRVPTFDNLNVDPSSVSDQHVIGTSFHTKDPEKSTLTIFSNSSQAQRSHEKPLGQSVMINSKTKKRERHADEQKVREAVKLKGHTEKTTSHLGPGEKNAQSSSILEESSDQVHSSVSITVPEKSQTESTICQKPGCDFRLDVPKFPNIRDAAEKGHVSRVHGGTASMVLDENNLGNLKMADSKLENAVQVPGLLEHVDMGKNDEDSETSMVDSEYGFDISPDGVVGVIGPKHFWKARRSIVNQQRVFAVQVFELHRLIKVQKLIAASPHILLEGSPHLTRPCKIPAKNPSSEHTAKSHQHTSKCKDDSRKANSDELATEKTVGPTTRPSPEDGPIKGPARQAVPNGHQSRNLPQVPTASKNKLPGPLCFQPPANQWLIPVISPSEGLVYKPYMGPCPPSIGLMAPIFGGAPMAMSPVAGDFVNAAYGIPAQHQQNVGILPGVSAASPNFFPAPYCLPVMNTVSSSAVDQMSSLVDTQMKDQLDEHSGSSGNLSHPGTEALSDTVQKIQASKESELQGSTMSCSNKRMHEVRDGSAFLPAAPLPAVPPVAEGSRQSLEGHNRDHQTRVIKVVPHKPASATESAARIFRTIQRDRRLHE